MTTPPRKRLKKSGLTLASILLIYTGSYLALRMSGRISVIPPEIYGNNTHHVFGVADEENGPLREDLRITYAFYPLCKIEEHIRNGSARSNGTNTLDK